MTNEQKGTTPGRGLAAGVLLALLVFGGGLFGLQWLTSDGGTPVRETPAADPTRSAETEAGVSPPLAALKPSGDGEPLIEGFKLLGEATAPSGRTLCSEQARSAMAAFGVSNSRGDVVVREADWSARATAHRVSLASWYSQCTREGRAVRILSEASGDVLAEYHPRLGYREPPPGFGDYES